MAILIAWWPTARVSLCDYKKVVVIVDRVKNEVVSILVNFPFKHYGNYVWKGTRG